MKTKILYLLFVLFFFSYLCYGQSVERNAPAKYWQQDQREIALQIKNFYISYATNVSNGFDIKNDELLKVRMTPNLIAKVQRMSLATQSDPIIRAQDFNSKLLSTFDVKHLIENWYMVSYAENTIDEKRVEIPIKATSLNEKLLIEYITPEWNNSLFGDSLLCKQKKQPLVDASTPLSLLKTFYVAYAMEYCNMPLDLSGNLMLCVKNIVLKTLYMKFKGQKKKNLTTIY